MNGDYKIRTLKSDVRNMSDGLDSASHMVTDIRLDELNRPIGLRKFVS